MSILKVFYTLIWIGLISVNHFLAAQSKVPEMIVSYKDDPATGYIYTALNNEGKGYLFAFDHEGLPVFKRVFDHSVENLQLWQGDIMSFFVDKIKGYVLLDSMYRIIDTVKMKNGYRADFHDFLLLPNGHKFLMCYDPRSVDMSKTVPGGRVNATVTGTVIQELDQNNQLIFQWLSWDHIPIADSYYNLTEQVIDYTHANSFWADTDSTLIISFRNTSEIIKISRKTGHIIWRMGGKNNQFERIGDTEGFRGQHSISFLDNGNLLLFDNAIDLENDMWLGNAEKKSRYSLEQYDDLISRGVEYAFSEEDTSITLLAEFVHDPPYEIPVKGHIQRLRTGHTLIHWSEAVPPAGKSITEYGPDGQVCFEAGLENLVISAYKVLKYPLMPGTFRTGVDSIDFGDQQAGTSTRRHISISNISDTPVMITSVIHDHPAFTVDADFPLTVEAGMGKEIPVSFRPSGKGFKEDVITFCSDTDTSGNAQQLYVSGIGTDSTNATVITKSRISISPNPAHDYLHINGLNEGDEVRIINIQGRVLIFETVQTPDHILDLKGLKPGTYLLRVAGRDGIFSGMFVRN